MSKKKQKIPLPQLDPSRHLIDTHCHLDMAAYHENLEDILDNAYSAGVHSIVTIGIDVASSKKAIKLARKYHMIKATVGIHPHDVENINSFDLDEIQRIIEHDRQNIVGYGEIGIDYVKKYSSPETQRHFFRIQLEIAREHKLPVIIHDREAHEDILRILKECAPFPKGGIMHCFSGNMDYARKILDLGFLISIPGIVTFKNALELREVASKIPLESILLETDGPFLAPVPYRGKRNEPAYLLYTAMEVANLRNISLAEIAEATTKNACKLFDIDKGLE